MTVSEAAATLKEPLVFGSQTQIDALRTLQALEEWHQLMNRLLPYADSQRCRACWGFGQTYCSECESNRKCKRCLGKGFLSCAIDYSPGYPEAQIDLNALPPKDGAELIDAVKELRKAVSYCGIDDAD